MSRSFLTSLNLNKNELLNARIQNLATAPGSPVEGQVYFDTTYGALRQYDGTVWKTYTKSGDIVNGDIAANAAIDNSKLATNPLDRSNHFNTQLSSTISDFDEAVQATHLNSLTVPNGNVDINEYRVTNVSDPIDPLDAANKQYVDAARSGLTVKEPVHVATTEQISLTGVQTIDNHLTEVGNRVLVKDQTSATENGIYVVASGAWSRAADADEDFEVTSGLFVFVQKGDVNGDNGYVLVTNDPIELGVTPLEFVQFSGAGQVIAGDGLTKNLNQLDVVGTDHRITVNADSVDIASDYVGQTSITTLGTVTTGTWEADIVEVLYGGTGADNVWDARANLGATTKYSVSNPELTPSSGAVTWTVTHNLETTDVVVQLRELTSGATIEADMVISSANTVSITWIASGVVSADNYRAVVIG